MPAGHRVMTVRVRLPAILSVAGALAGLAHAGVVQASGPELIHCYDAKRGLVQRTLPKACAGQIVDAARAEALERQHRQARAARFQANQPTPRDRRRAERSGSAVFVSDQGHLVTARHVVDGCRAIEVVLPDDRPVPARVVRVAAEADLAVLKVAHRPLAIVALAPLPGVNAAANLGRGIQEATAIGFPALGRVVVRPVSTRAPVLGKKLLQPGPIPRLVLQARVHPGNSGGPVVDQQGHLIGILVAKLNRAAVFARVGELPPDMAIAETGHSVAALLTAAQVPVAPIGGAGRGLQDALGASVRIECKP
jgi:S1-C subfamily serine protease